MRRVALPIVLALTSAPFAASAQATPGAPSEQPGAGTGAQAGEPGGSATSAQATEAAAESGPAASAAAEVRPGAPTPTPPPENLESRTTPIVEIHGYLRTRAELFNNFGLGWDTAPVGSEQMPRSQGTYQNSGLAWFRNPDNIPAVCGPPAGRPLPGDTSGATPMPYQGQCSNAMQTSANLRLRLMPEIHPTEFITIHSQIDLLDNLVLGSTPEGYYVPGGARSPWAPITAFSQTQIHPIFGYNSFTDSIVVKRAWAEVTNQSLGQIRFGRMPSHWGLGILANAGNGLDSDYQSTVDRLMYAARLRPLGIFLAAMWDFPSVGATSASRLNESGQGQPYDLGMFDDVHQWIIAIGRRLEPEQQRAALARGEVVVNGGAYLVYRTQYLSGEGSVQNNPSPVEAGTLGGFGDLAYGRGLVRRDASAFITDLWGQILGRSFRIEVEAAYIRGSILSLELAGFAADNYTISQFGGALEAEYRMLNNRLKLEFRGGYASGDPEFEGLNYFNGLRAQQLNDRFLTLFRFHPDYRIDLIFWRQIMRQFSGAYYLRPSVQYNFIADPGGDLVFGRIDAIWSRASEFIQTRGNHADLGIEIDGTIQYQSNHRRDPNDQRPLPGFYAMAQGGVFFPLGGLGPTDAERAPGGALANFQLQTAYTLRGFVGVSF